MEKATVELLDECFTALKLNVTHIVLIQVPMGSLDIIEWRGIPIKESFTVECITFHSHIPLNCES
jgi:hypothetical protein